MEFLEEEVSWAVTGEQDVRKHGISFFRSKHR